MLCPVAVVPCYVFLSGARARVCVCVRTFFVEYQFPVVATSRDNQQPNAMTTEVMRVVSKKVSDSCKCIVTGSVCESTRVAVLCTTVSRLMF